MKKAFGVNLDEHTGVILIDQKPFYKIWTLYGVYEVQEDKKNSGILVKWVVYFSRMNNWFMRLIEGAELGKQQYISSFGTYNKAVADIQVRMRGKGILLQYPIPNS